MKIEKSEFVKNYLERNGVAFKELDDYIILTGVIPAKIAPTLLKFEYKPEKPQPKKPKISEEAMKLRLFIQSRMGQKTEEKPKKVIFKAPEKENDEKPKKKFERPPAKYSNPDWFEKYSKY